MRYGFAGSVADPRSERGPYSLCSMSTAGFRRSCLSECRSDGPIWWLARESQKRSSRQWDSQFVSLQVAESKDVVSERDLNVTEMMPQPESDRVAEAASARRASRAPVGRLLTLPLACGYTGLSAWKLRQLIHNGKLPIVELNTGEKFWIDRRDLDALIERNKRTL